MLPTGKVEVLSGATAHGQGHRSITYEKEGQVIGFAYYAPAAMTDRTWYVYWIAVSKQIQARGVGQELLRYVEELSVAEIAVIMGRSAAAIDSLLQRARAVLFRLGRAYFVDTNEECR